MIFCLHLILVFDINSTCLHPNTIHITMILQGLCKYFTIEGILKNIPVIALKGMFGLQSGETKRQLIFPGMLNDIPQSF